MPPVPGVVETERDAESLRISAVNDRPMDGRGRYVLYWMTAFRRTAWNHALDRAVAWARRLGRPLLIVETLACGGPWDNRRHHRFVLEGMLDNAAACGAKAGYYPFVERAPGEAAELVAALAAESCVVVCDDFPLRGPRSQVAALALRSAVRVERVDSNGLLPLAAAERVFTVAHSFRRFLQQRLRDFLVDPPSADPLGEAVLPPPAAVGPGIARRWPAWPCEEERWDAPLSKLPIDQRVGEAPLRGGPRSAEQTLRRFVRDGLPRYDEDRNHPDDTAASGLSPFLHHGHLSASAVFHAVAKAQRWSPDRLAAKPNGRNTGWWGMSGPAEAFLDELVTWRELGYNMSALRDDYDRYESLPAWARATLARHARDPRPQLYRLAELEAAATHDPLWNAAQRELTRQGRMHNYLRMLWGKKILQWSATPQEAVAAMIELNNRYALDGNDPNSYSGIFWVLGRYDRAWGPERPIFGTVRYMASENTARKLRLERYLARHA